MATGAGLGGLMAAMMPLIGIVMILRNRSTRKAGKSAEVEGEGAQTSAAEVQRRMDSYLASRNSDA